MFSIAGDLATSQEVSFNQQIRPILSKNCISCHGPDEDHRGADLRLDIRDDALAAIEPADPDSSELFARIISDGDDRMPPAEHANQLRVEEIELIRRWIEQGASYEQHWSFVRPSKPVIPDPVFKDWGRNEIDRFVESKLSDKNLTPSSNGDPHRLIRRVALDLTGLPPTKETVARYAANPTDEAYEKIVDDLLDSADYGEHWAAMWMDIARYADTMGYAEDKKRDIWPWRDWVIRAFNDNRSWDEFTIEQIAGDLIPNATEDQKLATAFHRNTLSNTEGGTNDEEFRMIAVKDRISTTVNVWMGLTMRCAECHTHKYDPISQTEYYQFLDFFNQTVDSDKNDEKPHLEVYPASRAAQFREIDKQIAELEMKIENAPKVSNEKAAEAVAKKELDPMRRQLASLLKKRNSPIRVPVLEERADKNRRETFVNIRGNFMAKGDKVEPAVPQAFNSLPDGAPRNRLGVAYWLVSKENPLTARATVNRFWASLFGIGIVETEEDLGTQGTPPVNQDLLDWLAVDFQENDWNVKRLLKQMVMSSAYRQDNRATSKHLKIDPRNRYLARGPRFRLTAEVVRDQALAVSGLLSKKQYGPPVYPTNPVKLVRNAFTGGTKWIASEGEDRYRRAVYTFLKRSSPHPLFETFDMASRTVCNMRRIRTNTPLQSFMTLNDETFIAAAKALSSTMAEGESVEEQITIGLETALLHPAREDHLSVLVELYQETLVEYESDPTLAASLLGSEGAELNRTAALVVVANVILNLDEFLTR